MTGSVSLAAQASQTLRFAAGLAAFLRTPLTGPASHDLIARNLTARTANFLTMVERAVYRRPHSPYRRLIAHAGIELGDLRAMVAAEGLEGALERLYDASASMSASTSSRAACRSGAAAWSSTPGRTISTIRWRPVTSGPVRRLAQHRHADRLDLAHYAQDAAYDTACWKRMSCWVGPTRSGVLHRPGPPG